MSLRLRNKNEYLSRVLIAGECEMWKKNKKFGLFLVENKVIKKRNFLDLLIFTQILVT